MSGAGKGDKHRPVSDWRSFTKQKEKLFGEASLTKPSSATKVIIKGDNRATFIYK